MTTNCGSSASDDTTTKEEGGASLSAARATAEQGREALVAAPSVVRADATQGREVPAVAPLAAPAVAEQGWEAPAAAPTQARAAAVARSPARSASQIDFVCGLRHVLLHVLLACQPLQHHVVCTSFSRASERKKVGCMCKYRRKWN